MMIAVRIFIMIITRIIIIWRAALRSVARTICLLPAAGHQSLGLLCPDQSGKSMWLGVGLEHVSSRVTADHLLALAAGPEDLVSWNIVCESGDVAE